MSTALRSRIWHAGSTKQMIIRSKGIRLLSTVEGTPMFTADALLGVKKLPPAPKIRDPQIDELGRAYATGGRKTSVARVWIKPGNGTIVVNGKQHTEYFPRITHRSELITPFMTTQTLTKFDVWCTVRGGGVSGTYNVYLLT